MLLIFLHHHKNPSYNHFTKTVKKFIHWLCIKFPIAEEDDLLRKFEFKNATYIDHIKQIEYEEEQEYDKSEIQLDKLCKVLYN